MVFTNQLSQNLNGEKELMQNQGFDNHQEKPEDIASINHIRVKVVKESSLDDELEEAPPVFERCFTFSFNRIVNSLRIWKQGSKAEMCWESGKELSSIQTLYCRMDQSEICVKKKCINGRRNLGFFIGIRKYPEISPIGGFNFLWLNHGSNSVIDGEKLFCCKSRITCLLFKT